MSSSLDTKLSQLTLAGHISVKRGSGVGSMAELSQVFLGATELVEIVLLDDILRKDDLMRVRRVCRRLRVIVDGTLSLRSKLFLAPAYNIPPKSVGFVAAPRYRDFVYINKQGTLKFEMRGSKQKGTDRWDFKIGTYYQRMFLVQPPIKSVVLNNYHCVFHRDHGRGAILINCETGIVLGHLAKALETKSQLCNACGENPSLLSTYGKAVFRVKIDASNQCSVSTATDAIREAVMSDTRPLQWADGRIKGPEELDRLIPDEKVCPVQIHLLRGWR